MRCRPGGGEAIVIVAGGTRVPEYQGQVADALEVCRRVGKCVAVHHGASDKVAGQ